MSLATSVTWTGLEKVLGTTGAGLGINGVTGLTLSITIPNDMGAGFDAALNNAAIDFSNVISLTITAGTGNDASYPNLATKLAATSSLATLTLALSGVADDIALYKAVKDNSNITTVTWTSGVVGSCAVADINTDSTFDSVSTCLATTVKAS